MADLPETPLEYPAGIYQLEETDAALGGAPNPATGGGLANLGSQQLAKRTAWLRTRVDTLLGYFQGGKIKQSALPKVDDADKLDGQHGSWYADVASRLGYTPMNATRAPDFTSVALAPWYPEVETPDHRLAVSVLTGDNSIVLDTDQTWIWRGGRRFSSSDLSERIFPTASGRTYHLRWHAPGTGIAADAAEHPSGRLELADMTGEAETATTHDSTFDRMLIARVVTDTAGVPTVRPLHNAAKTQEIVELAPGVTDPGTNDMTFSQNFGYDLAVTPRVHAHLREAQTDAVDGTGDIRDHDTYTRVSEVTRYGARVHGKRDFATSVEITAIYWV